MGRFYFPRILLISALLLSLSFSLTRGKGFTSSEYGGSAVAVERVSVNAREMMMQTIDYEDPGPNPRNRKWLSPPPPATPSFSPPPPTRV